MPEVNLFGFGIYLIVKYFCHNSQGMKIFMLENVANELFNFRTTLILIKHVATAAHKQHCKAEKLKIYLNSFMYFI